MLNQLLSSPHLHGGNRTQRIMILVIVACVPGLIAQTLWFGYGSIINVVWAIALGLALEASIMKLRKRPIKPAISDGSVILTCLLLGLALPPHASWWLVSIGVLFAVIFAKHLYGGLGNNPFNPAMVGYALLLIAFPAAMTVWGNPEQQLSFSQQWQWFWSQDSNIDAYTQATPLDAYKHLQGSTINEMRSANPGVMAYEQASWWINMAYLAGGLALLALGVFTWHAPVAMLVSLTVLAFLFGTGEPDLYASPMQHLTLGATMFAAFFIITDPVTSATSRQGKLIFGAGIGILIYIIRTWGSYPDAVAFAVLLLNLSAPFIDQYTQPKVYGSNKG